MLSKLSLRNATRQMKDYLIYFITIVIAATLIFSFNSLVFSQEIRSLSKLLDTLTLMIGIASFVVVCIIGWLVFYTMRFMMKRRSREFGTYLLLGIERKRIVNLFFLENLIIGAVALLIGLLTGNLLYQGLRAMLLRLYEIQYHFSYEFSLPATLLTFAYFALIFIVALFLNRRKIRKSKISELIYMDQYNEKELATDGKKRRRLFVASVISGIVGIGLLITYDATFSLIGAFAIIFFLFTFYISFSSGISAYFKKHERKKYSGNTLYVFRSLASKVGSMGITLSVISILLTATLIAVGTGLSFNHLFMRNAELETSHSIYIGSEEKADFSEYKIYIDENLNVTSQWQYNIYKQDSDSVTRYVDPYRDNFRAYDYDTVMAFSDYTRLRDMLGYHKVTLPEGEYIIQCLDYLAKPLAQYNEAVRIGDRTLLKRAVYYETFTQQHWNGNGSGFILVVPDEIAEALPVSHSAYAAMTDEPVTMTEYEALDMIRMHRHETDRDAGYDMIYSKEVVKEQNASLYAVIIFPLFYVALVLLIVSATVLAIQILSEMKGYQNQYAVLHMLGAERKYLSSALRRQFAVYYILPIIPAAVISSIFIFFLCLAFDPGVFQDIAQIFMIVGATLAIFFAVFAIYIAASYVSLRRNILPDDA
ncbi:ABC transporter permease [Paenibacillus antibioticophila]|uniref:ABC transporter permease n=1 Tax=Paenibacillus antibioticophila TaxID=1274374 RepID=UPI0005C866B7|nr:ABC transporter permease [Paenibacillus antibioticophila]